MPVGTFMPSFKLKDSDGFLFDSERLRESRLVLVVFTCNHCPYAIASWPVLNDLQERYEIYGLETIAINSNNHPDYPEDAFEKMAEFKKNHKITFPYLFDEDQKVARAFGAVCTPDPFLFLEGKLYYHGRLTDNWRNPEAVSDPSMERFIEAALERGPLPKHRYPSMGCSIKWQDGSAGP